MSAKFSADPPLFRIQVVDAQQAALAQIGRALTLEELESVKDGLEWGLSDCQGDVMRDTIEEAAKNPELDHNHPLPLDYWPFIQENPPA